MNLLKVLLFPLKKNLTQPNFSSLQKIYLEYIFKYSEFSYRITLNDRKSNIVFIKEVERTAGDYDGKET